MRQLLLTEEKDRYIRLFAEFENYKKRTQKEKMEFYQYASQDLIVSLLGVLDDFERAIKELAKNENIEELKGVELIYNKFKNKNGKFEQFQYAIFDNNRTEENKVKMR